MGEIGGFMSLLGWLLFFILLPIALIAIIVTVFIGTIVLATIIELFREIIGKKNEDSN
jgi:hypothetical protein